MIDLIVTIAVCVVIAAVVLLMLRGRFAKGNSALYVPNRYQREQAEEIERLKAQGRYLSPDEAARRFGGAA